MIARWTDRIVERLVGGTTAHAGLCQPGCWLVGSCARQFACNMLVGRVYECRRSDCSKYRQVICGC